jgi:hypothetical protein
LSRSPPSYSTIATSSVASPTWIGGDPAIDPDAVIEVNDVVSPLELSRCSRRGGLPVAARPAQATSPAENLVVGQHPEGAHHEPAVQSADGQRHIEP